MQKKKLLLINGSRDLMDMNKRILERAGYSVTCAIGLDGAETELKTYTPDGIILASDLPDGSGLGFLKDQCTDSGIPVLFLSDNRYDEVTALNAGANDFLKKPYDFEVLITRIEMMLNRYGEDDEEWGSKERETGSHEHLGFKSPQNPDTSKKAEDAHTAHATKKEKKDLFRFRNVAAALVVVALIAGGFVINQLNRPPDIDIPEGDVPLGAAPTDTYEENGTFVDIRRSIEIPALCDVSIPADKTNVRMDLLNPIVNKCDFVFEIVLVDAGERLFISGPVAPGEELGDIVMSRSLSEGEYDALLVIHTFLSDGESSKPIGSITSEFVISVVEDNAG